MATPAPKCAAAKGLPGDVLGNLCIDFSMISDQTLMNPPPQGLSGWDFNNPPSCWEISGGKLQIKGFSGFSSTCTFKMPAVNLNDADKQKYQSVTLSVLQRADLNYPNQIAQGGLGSVLPNRTVWSTSGKNERQQLILSLARTDTVPMATGAIYQYVFQITSSVMAGGTAQGWQIESIAVLGNP